MKNKWKDKAEFKQRVRYFADKMNININRLAVRPMSTKWASCSTNGNLHFNKELIKTNNKIASSRHVFQRKERVSFKDIKEYEEHTHGRKKISPARSYNSRYMVPLRFTQIFLPLRSRKTSYTRECYAA